MERSGILKLLEVCKDIQLTWTWPGVELQVDIIDGVYDYTLYDVDKCKVIEYGPTTVTDILTKIQELNNGTTKG